MIHGLLRLCTVSTIAGASSTSIASRPCMLSSSIFMLHRPLLALLPYLHKGPAIAEPIFLLESNALQDITPPDISQS
ncbi:hypothetical protein J3E74DRAFT_366607 [Bipolaris maydis]|nr:hypothetical protein J3E74DRAFT_366607 [Bipolaris maydis]